MGRKNTPYSEAYRKGFAWGRAGREGHGWCHYDSYLEPELVEEWWAGYEAGTTDRNRPGWYGDD